ncbi:MAG TPA: hypothetical protein VKE69_14225 [Planctomycetota bacterium]|nr:hypothetical protein [Planctomycetota bacterium]
MARAHEAAALAALKRADRDCDFGGTDEVQQARTFELALKAAGWAVHRDADGNVDGILAEGPCRAEAELLDALAAFVRAGSSIVLLRPGHPPMLHTFDGKRRRDKRLHLDDPVTKDLLQAPTFEERPSTRIPIWTELKAEMPAVQRPYRPTDTYAKNEWVAHPKFGAGVVFGVEGAKIRVLFEAGERVLVHGAK